MNLINRLIKRDVPAGMSLFLKPFIYKGVFRCEDRCRAYEAFSVGGCTFREELKAYVEAVTLIQQEEFMLCAAEFPIFRQTEPCHRTKTCCKPN